MEYKVLAVFFGHKGMAAVGTAQRVLFGEAVILLGKLRSTDLA